MARTCKNSIRKYNLCLSEVVDRTGAAALVARQIPIGSQNHAVYVDLSRVCSSYFVRSLAFSFCCRPPFRNHCWYVTSRSKFRCDSNSIDHLFAFLGTLFWQSSDTPNSIVGVLFQSLLFVVIGAMTTVIKQFPNRSIFYKHQDANFFPTWTYVMGRSAASLPYAIADAVIYGKLFLLLLGLNDVVAVAHSVISAC
jgi:hypothetical protein